MTIEPINLDAMEADDLVILGNDDTQPLAYRLYAKKKAQAMTARLAGQLALAIRCELSCDHIYSTMHELWRW